MMPGLSGLELCRQIRALPQGEHMPIIMSSAAVEPPDREDALFDAFVAKPTYFDELLEEIARLLKE